MKKVITICLLVVTLLVGGMTVEAKTTKKKGRTRTTQTYSSQWNGDIPPASFLANTFFFGSDHPNNKNILKDHGYTPVTREFRDDCYVKEGVCEIEVAYSAQSMEIFIVVYDSEQRNWLYNNILSFKKSQKSNSPFFGTWVDGTTIFFGYSKWSYD